MCNITAQVPAKSADLSLSSGELAPGMMDIRHFRLLITICMIRNIRMQQALEDVLVHGLPRQAACKKNTVSQSYFSQKYHHIQMVNSTVMRLCEFKSEK
ncbi:TPA: transcriptional regulator [Citrobacter werkmanii]|nr:transcriptional regulator [Citrobacter werkmanii]